LRVKYSKQLLKWKILHSNAIGCPYKSLGPKIFSNWGVFNVFAAIFDAFMHKKSLLKEITIPIRLLQILSIDISFSLLLYLSYFDTNFQTNGHLPSP